MRNTAPLVAEPASTSFAQVQAPVSFTRDTPGSQTLARGLSLLRAFRLGNFMLSNAELAERTQLPRPTVTRLTRSLVEWGFLTYDASERAYRLGAISLSLAQAFREEQPILKVAVPLMRSVAEGEQINVGLAVASHLEMVYLESVRESRHGVFRRLAAGSRIPMESTAMGRAYLAGLDPQARETQFALLAAATGPGWPTLAKAIVKAVRAVHRDGYCLANWQPGMSALAAPWVGPDGNVYALNISFPSTEGQLPDSASRLVDKLLDLKARIALACATN